MRNFILAIFFCCAVCAWGQKTKVNFGAEAGYTYNWINGDGNDSKGRSGFNVGLLADFEFHNNLTLQTGLGFVKKGGTIWGNNMLPDYRDPECVKYHHLDYWRLPVTLGYRVKVAHGFSITPQIGWYFAYGSGGVAFCSGDFYSYRAEVFDKDVNKISLGQIGREGHWIKSPRFDTGLSLAVNFTYRHFGLKIMYDYGVTDVYRMGQNCRNSTLSTSLIYWLK